MNVIDLLVEDHNKLRKELVELNRALAGNDLRNRIKVFISKHEMHESTEEEILFPALDNLPKEKRAEDLIFHYKKMHERIWALLDQLVNMLGRARFNELQEVFFHFAASMEAHMSQEDRILFPTIRTLMAPAALEELGKKALERRSKAAEL